jgi:hypothetical protein
LEKVENTHTNTHTHTHTHIHTHTHTHTVGGENGKGAQGCTHDHLAADVKAQPGCHNLAAISFSNVHT